MAELLGVELARPGTWDLAVGGRTEFTVDMLRDAADFFAATGSQPLPIGLGHTDDRFDGDPAFGLVHNVRYVEDEPGYDPGPVLLGDVRDVPDWLHAAAPSRWPNRSIEGIGPVEFEGRKYGLALTRLAFLGATPPAMRNLRSLSHIQEALAAALAAAPRIAASAPITASTNPPMEGAGMNLAKIREALAGLPDDASEEDIQAALAASGLSASQPQAAADPPQPAPTPEPAPQLAPAPPQATEQGTQDLDQRLAAAAAKGGVITIDAAQVSQFQEGMRKAAALAKQLDERERDEAITGAIKAGKFPVSRRAHYERYWEADPDGARQLIASLAAGLVPVTALGHAGEGDDALFDAEYRHLFPPTGKGR